MGSSESKSDKLEREAREVRLARLRERKRQLERYEEIKQQQEYERHQELMRQAALTRIRETDFSWQDVATYLLLELTKKITDSLKSEEQEKEAREERAREERRKFEKQQQELRRQTPLLTIRRQTDSTWGELPTRISNLYITEEPEQQKGFIEEIKPNPELIQSLLQSIGKDSWTDKIDDDQVYVLETLDSDSQEFKQQNKLFRESNKMYFNITDIEKIFNPYLFLKFKLKEKQYKKRVGYVQTMKMYHGTMKQNTDGICETNFDWRRNGKSTGHRFGQGVSFSPYSNYATHYGNKKSFDKVMFAVDMLVGGLCKGEANTVIPDGNADTTVNEKGSVYVKYEDDAFYPTYLIHYQGFEGKK